MLLRHKNIEMKKLITFCSLLTFIFASCSTDLTDVEKRLDELENSGKKPKLLSISFLSKDNSMQLVEDVNGEIIGDSVVECWVKNIMSDKLLIPKVEFVGESIKLDDVPVAIGSSKHDFKRPVKLTITNGDKSKEYTIYVHSYTGLPVMWIETEGRKDITSKEVYQRASFKLVEDVKTRAAGDVIEDSVSIKGRGNATWSSYPKKPFNFKFDKKRSLLGMPEDKSWVLLANYADKTFIRNHIAFYMGYMSNLNYTTRSHYVEVMLNGRYNGVYDAYAPGEADSRYFSIVHLNQVVNIKDPEVEYNDDNYNYAKEFVTIADSVLYSNNFTDPNSGWQKYLDMDSFIDWMLINEISKNLDSFWWSGYFSLKRGDKLRMEPLWDFDHSFGNYVRNGIEYPSGWAVKQHSWYARLFQDPAFVGKAKERYNYFYSKREDIMKEINACAQYLSLSSREDNNKWGTLYRNIGSDSDIWGSYQNEVQSMKEWLNARFEWLKTEFDKM